MQAVENIIIIEPVTSPSKPSAKLVRFTIETKVNVIKIIITQS